MSARETTPIRQYLNARGIFMPQAFRCNSHSQAKNNWFRIGEGKNEMDIVPGKRLASTN